MKIELNAYAKTNLSLEICSKRDDGYHDIHSVMQAIDLYDRIIISTDSVSQNSVMVLGVSIDLDMNTSFSEKIVIEDNLAFLAAKAFFEALPVRTSISSIKIFIDKSIPMAAGLAGGSSDAACVLLGLDALFGFPLDLDSLYNLGIKIGSDVPFEIMMNAYLNSHLLTNLAGLEQTSPKALVRGRGRQLTVLESNENLALIIANPGVKISTRDTYLRLDESGLSYEPCYDLFFNRLEDITLKHCPSALELYNLMQDKCVAEHILMSGSGPSILAYYSSLDDAKSDFEILSSSSKAEWKFWISRFGGFDNGRFSTQNSKESQ